MISREDLKRLEKILELKVQKSRSTWKRWKNAHSKRKSSSYVLLLQSEKKKMRRMKKPRNLLLDLAESFCDEIKTLPLEDSGFEHSTVISNGSRSETKLKKQKVN